LSQLAGEFMLVKPQVIDLGWGGLKSAIVKLADSGFVTAREAKAHRETLVGQYVAAFREVERGDLGAARVALKSLSENIAGLVVSEQQVPLRALVDGQVAKLG